METARARCHGRPPTSNGSSSLLSAIDSPSFLPLNPQDNSLFDASQYAFFGQNVAEEVELGGLDVDEDNHSLAGLPSDEYHLFDRDEGHDVGLGSLSDIDDLETTFSKLNRVVSGPRNPGVIGDRGSGSLSRESSSAAEWSRDGWLDHTVSDVDIALESSRWSSHPNSSFSHSGEFNKPLYRALSYPEQQLQQHQYLQQDFPSETLSTLKSSSFTSFPPPGGAPQPPLSHRHSLPLNFPSMNTGLDSTFSAPNISPGISTAHGFGRSMPGVTHSQPRNQWSNHAGLLHGDHSRVLNNVLQQQLNHQNSLLYNSPLVSPRQHLFQQGLGQSVPSLAHLSFLQSQLIASHASAPSHLLRKYDSMYGIAEMRDHQRSKSVRGKHHRFNRQGSDSSVQKEECIQFSSKYMTAEEIGSILKMQHTSHSNDPYIDDYYHQASIAKKSSGLRLKPHFAPLHLRDVPSRSRNSGSDQHSHQSFDTLRRLALSSVRRPRPLLEVEPPSSGCSDGGKERRSLEQEPMFAARIAVEDAFTLLLDVDDIDRVLRHNPPQDGGSQLRRKRQVLLEALATALQLVDPFGSGGSSVGPGDDIVFMRIVSLPKGCKLLSKYVELVIVNPGPASELARIVCMGVFRHLRFLYGRLPTDATASEAIVKLAKVVSTCVGGMDLRGLSACLAAVVCSTEQPPLRPLGSPTGDHASLILKAVLDRATELLNSPNPQASGSWSVSSLSFWKASFGAFFTLITKYCVSKYDSIMQSMVNRSQPSSDITSSEAARAIRGEMPVELLRASLFHTDEHQRRMLMAFAHKSIPFPVTGFNLRDEENIGQINSESVRS
ncbi:protein PAT1 homolog 2-like [Silene latifolia]|uniref:protein PAT1 homolog 2-like n=1 Tax=Silene latifolia TaxID=37657 RepID=UPI003D76F443